jgi:hypothetical protein
MNEALRRRPILDVEVSGALHYENRPTGVLHEDRDEDREAGAR